MDFREGRFDTNNNVVPGTETETQNWTLDGVGNWATTVQDGVTKNQTVNNVNEYTAFAGVANAHDANGNYLDDGSFTYKWDFLNRLREVRRKSDGALLATYIYDALGRRVRRETTASANIGALVEKYFYDGAQCIEERRDNDTVQKQYVTGGLDEWLIQDRDTDGDGILDASSFYHANALGSVAALTDLAGAVTERYTYSSYGRPLFENPNSTPATSQIQSAQGNPHLFAGYRFDPEAGLSYVRRRYLHHGQGRWVSREPLGTWRLARNLGSAYAYAYSAPTTWRDSTGRDPDQLSSWLKRLWRGGGSDPLPLTPDPNFGMRADRSRTEPSKDAAPPSTDDDLTPGSPAWKRAFSLDDPAENKGAGQPDASGTTPNQAPLPPPPPVPSAPTQPSILDKWIGKLRESLEPQWWLVDPEYGKQGKKTAKKVTDALKKAFEI